MEPMRSVPTGRIGAFLSAGLLTMTPACGGGAQPPPSPPPQAPSLPGTSAQPSAPADSSVAATPDPRPTTGSTHGRRPSKKPTGSSGSSIGTTKVDSVTALARTWPTKVKAGSKITVQVAVSGDQVPVLVRLRGTCYADVRLYPKADFYLQWHGKWTNVTAGSVPHPAVVTVSARLPKQCGSTAPANGGPDVADAATKKSYGLDGHDFTVYR